MGIFLEVRDLNYLYLKKLKVKKCILDFVVSVKWYLF